MKYVKRLLTVPALLAGLVLATSLSLYAQSQALKVDIPFEFQAGSKTLPAGTYIVEKRGDALLISDGKGHGVAVLANGIQNKAYRTKDLVVFNRYGDKRFLSEVRWRDYSTARALLESPEEHRLAQALRAETENVASVVR